MKNKIIGKLIEFHISGKNRDFSEFKSEYESNFDIFSETLKELRDTELSCVEEYLFKKIMDCSQFFSGKEVILLEVVLLMLYYNINCDDNIRFILKRYNELKETKQPNVMPYDTVYEATLTKIFMNDFEVYPGLSLNYDIENYIDPKEIQDISIASLYYSVIRKMKPDKFETMPLNIMKIGLILETFGVIDCDGLGCLYEYFDEEYIGDFCEVLEDVGASAFAKIIVSGFTVRDNYDKIENLENKFYSLENKININELVEKCLDKR